MILLNLLTGLGVGAASAMLLQRYIQNVTLQSLLTVIVIAVTMGMTKIYIIPYYAAATYEYRLQRSDPVFKLIAKTFPVEYKNYIEKAIKSTQSGTELEDRMIDKMAFLNGIFIKITPSASNQTIAKYYQLELTLDKEIMKINPKLVLYFEFYGIYKPTANPRLITSLLTPSMFDSLIAAKEEVIAEAITHPEPPLTEEEKKQASQVILSIVNQLKMQYGDQTVTNLNSEVADSSLSMDQATKVASVIINFYENISKTGEVSAGLAYRLLALKLGSPA